VANIPFDPIVYKLIKANYTHNIGVFNGLGPGQKIGFDGNTGRFSVQSNKERGNLSADSKQSAKDADTFVFPVTALMYEASRNNIKPRLLDQEDQAKPYRTRSAQEFVNDLSHIEAALGTLLATYSDRWQFFKTDQKNNIRTLQDTAKKFKSIIMAGGNWQRRYSNLNFEFAQATNFKSSPGVHSIIVNALNNTTIKKYITNLKMQGIDEVYLTSSSLNKFELITNVEYFYYVKKLADKLYENFYSGGTSYHGDAGEFITYLEGLKKSAQGAKIEFQFDQEIVFENNRFKQVRQMKINSPIKEPSPRDVTDYSEVYNNGRNNFVWFDRSATTSSSKCRVYLNVQSSATNHQAVIREIYNLKIGAARNLIKAFKTATYLNSRPDSMCIYCNDLAGARNVAKLISENEVITRLLNRSVANTQKQLYPGIGIGEEPETNIMGATKNSSNRSQWEPSGFSYGTHRCFLIAWAIIRTCKSNTQGHDCSSREFLQRCITEAQLIFEENGLDFTKPHKDSTLNQDKKLITQQLWAQTNNYHIRLNNRQGRELT